MLFVCGWNLSNHPARTGNAGKVGMSEFLLPPEMFVPFMLKCHWNNKGVVSRTYQHLGRGKCVLQQHCQAFTACQDTSVWFSIVSKTSNCKTVFFPSRKYFQIRLETDTESKHQFCQGAPRSFASSALNLSFTSVHPRLNPDISLESGDRSNLKIIVTVTFFFF